MLYATITGQDPRGAPHRIVGRPTLRDGTVDESKYEVLVDLPSTTAEALQTIAWDLVSRARR